MTEPQNDFLTSQEILSIPDLHRFSYQAMATMFEILIVHRDGHYAEGAANAAFQEVDRLEAELSRFQEASDISAINGSPVNMPFVAGLDTFACLKHCIELSNATQGAFDAAFGSSERQTISQYIKLNEEEKTVEVLKEGLSLDLGAYGKGYAVDRVAELLLDWDLKTALIIGGCSSIVALDGPQGQKGWAVTLPHPDRPEEKIDKLFLQNQSLGCSGLQKGLHIIDPRTGLPVSHHKAAWVKAPDAATADAISTAFMVMTKEQVIQFSLSHPEIAGLIMAEEVFTIGNWK